MSDLNTNPATRYGGVTRTAAEIDQGLRSYMLGVYNYMTIALAITGLFAFGMYKLSVAPDAASAVAMFGRTPLTSIGALVFKSYLYYVFMFAPLAIVFFMSFN